MRKASAAWMSAELRTRRALITLQPVRRAASRQKDGPSSPCSWIIASCSSSAAVAISAQGRVDEDADDHHLPPKLGADLERGRRVAAPRAEREVVEADRPGAQPDRLARVLDPRDPAELDPHRDTMVEPPGAPGAE